MARSTNAMITYNDLDYMVDNEGFRAKTTIPTSNRCMTKSALEASTYVYFTDTYANNQLVPYNHIHRGLYVSAPADIETFAPAQSFPFDLEVDGNWSITDDRTWITVTPSSGEDNESGITVSLTQNTGSARSGTITVHAIDANQYYYIDITQAEPTGVDVDPITLGYSASDAQDACLDYVSGPFTYYITAGRTFYNAISIFVNDPGATYLPAGWVSNGIDARYWTGSNFTAQTPCVPEE
ncbi:BACON domain-containing protein [Allomuricauda taeanensis]|uniref:BACON domain-containing protein n=1 Tax=Flagellimonas taeanensis TaxID=1005926 RepID=UPI002E7BBB00|nr:BACON domain-containing protein [Allomuricauda taeanensis]MEE1963554.1 BACON domain-containing protein [Allomuricauda taeanensis]